MIAWFAGQPLLLNIALGGLGALLLLCLLWLLWLRQYLEWRNVKTLEIEKRVGLKIEFIKTAAQILGGAFFLFGLYFTWQNLVVTQEKNRADLFMAQEKQATELYTKAIEQLGNAKLEVRLGGIYALERIARDSEKDHGPIIEVLTAYVRENAPWPPKKPAEAKARPDASSKPAPGVKKPDTKAAPEVKPRADIQAILTVLGRRVRTVKSYSLDLSHTDLRGSYLFEAHLEGASLNNAHLEGAQLWVTHLEGANLNNAHLEGATLIGANLDGARLKNTNLEGALIMEEDLKRAKGLTHEQIASVKIVKKDELLKAIEQETGGPDNVDPK